MHCICFCCCLISDSVRVCGDVRARGWRLRDSFACLGLGTPLCGFGNLTQVAGLTGHVFSLLRHLAGSYFIMCVCSHKCARAREGEQSDHETYIIFHKQVHVRYHWDLSGSPVPVCQLPMFSVVFPFSMEGVSRCGQLRRRSSNCSYEQQRMLQVWTIWPLGQGVPYWWRSGSWNEKPRQRWFYLG